MNKQNSRTHLVSLALAAVAMLVSLATLASLIPSPRQMLARGIRSELDDAPSPTVALHLARLETLQSDALPALVDALASDRIDVSSGARKLIDAEFNRWQELPTGVGSRHVEHLAGLLAMHVSRFGPASREHARHLALRIVQWPIDRDVVDRTELIAMCETVLRIAGQVVPATLAGETTNRGPLEGEATGREAGDKWRVRQPQENASVRTSDDPRRDSGLPIEPSIPSATDPTLGVLRPPVAEDRSQSSVLPEARDARRLPLATSRPLIATREPRVAFPPPSKRLRTVPLALPSRDEIRSAETIVVMRWLLVGRAASDAIDELSDRGFSQTQIQIARQIIDPDPLVRLNLAKSLPNIAEKDPRPWLLWLSRDADPNVRRATVAILATSPDPALQNRLRELELEETDATVLRVVRRALEQRGRRF